MTARCYDCKKPIDDEEYVVNWGSCSRCFDRAYWRYMRWARLRDWWRGLFQ